MDILEYQEEHGIAGSLLEIGVFSGRYFSILLRSASRTNSRVVGVDLFRNPPIEKIRELVVEILRGSDAVAILLSAYSIELDSARLLERLSIPARFVSIDGSHICRDVLWDLRLAEQIVAPAGVVAIDDFINPVAFGVNEAVHIFFSIPRRLVPWAYIENKLFLCQPQWADRYKAFLESTVMSDTVERHSAFFQKNARVARNLVEQTLWGAPLLVLSP
jgi:hypothetical protein